MNVLHVDCSVRVEHSDSRMLSARAVERLKANAPQREITVHRLDLADTPPRFPSKLSTEAMYVAPDDRSEAQRSAIQASDLLVDQLLASDIVVLGTPMYNFTVPSNLKAYIDNIVRVGRTFTRDYEGKLVGKKMYCISTRGADYSKDPFTAMDFLNPYIKAVFGFMGLTDIIFINAEPTQFMGPEARELGIQAAIERIDALVTV